MKKCRICGNIKSVDDFHCARRNLDGRMNLCKLCHEKEGKRRVSANREHVKNKRREWYLKNSAHVIEKTRLWRINNPEKCKKNRAEWKANHPDIIKESERKSGLKCRSTPKGKLSRNISCAIYLSLKSGSKKRRHWEDIVPFTIGQLKKHLEKQFFPGMTWENYGPVWHIDHKIPKTAFNFETPEDLDFRLCWTLKNLQPMWARDNIVKSDSIERPFQPSLAIRAFDMLSESLCVDSSHFGHITK